MDKKKEQLRNEFLQNQEILNKAKEKLKQEFVGLDIIINEIIDSVSSWYLFPDMQEKPVVINLWGLTGVGKSSLVNRLVDLIGFSNRHYRFDVGGLSGKNNMNIINQLTDLHIKENNRPVVISFDEFQHAKSIDEDDKEQIKSEDRIIWKILDNGKFDTDLASYRIAERFSDIISYLYYIINKGVKAKNGVVVSQKDIYIETKNYYKLNNASKKDRKKIFAKYDNIDLLLIGENYYELFYNSTPELFANEFKVKEKLLSLNEKETLEFVKNILALYLQPTTIDCTKSIVFIIGNLDEAYTMSHNYNPDLSADEFHELSLKINISDIKKALKKRFRNEEIARLGNTHIIYPAFNSDSFKKIINMELNKIILKVYKKLKISLEFDESITELIYKEGVYPTQGTRPIFTTINQIINSKLATIATTMILHNIESDSVRLGFKDNIMHIDYIYKTKTVFSIKEKLELKLEKLRKSKRDDMQAITAVHESGHAICSVFLMQTVPELIYSKTAETDNCGFVYTKYKWNYISKKEILNRLTVFLGGYVAEKFVFGIENITTGAESDINSATRFISEMLKVCGMGEVPAKYQVEDIMTNMYLHDNDNQINKEIKQWIISAVNLAEKLFKKQETLLLQMANYLSDNRMMPKELLQNYCERYGSDFSSDSIIKNGDLMFYRKHLKQKVENTELRTKELPVNTYEISLNKNNNY